MMTKIAKLTLMLLIVTCGTSVAQINTPVASPPGSVYTQVGLTDVTIDYFRPKMKGRKIFGAGNEYLEQYGNLWRTGANSGSKIKFSTDVKVAGQNVPAGEYLILTVPGENMWDFILYSDVSIGGNMSAFKKENEVVRTTIKPDKLSKPVETLTFQISDISEDNTTANIHLTWSNVSVKVPVVVDFDSAVMEEIASKTKVNPSAYAQAARYYYDNDKDLEQALKWINMYLEEEGNQKHFWYVHLKAQILAELGRKKEAIETAQNSIEIAKANEGGDFGYVKRNETLINELK